MIAIARLLLLACAGVVMQVGWVMIWTLSYHLTHGNDFSWTYLTSRPPVWEKLMDLLMLGNTLAPGFELPPFQGPASLDIIVNSVVFAFVITGVGYLGAILLVDLGISAVRGAILVILLFEGIFQVTLFVMPGLYTTDISSYVMYGRISAVYNTNPYIYPPNAFPSDPVLAWIHPIWHDQPSVYGPLWTDLAWLLTRLMAPFDGLLETTPDGQVLQVGLLNQVFGYKLLMNGVQVINLALAWWLLGRVMRSRPRARLTAFVVFAWNPLMLFDAAGNAHNDALMVTLLLLGMVPLVLGVGRAPLARGTNVRWLAATFLVGMSALIKYTTGLVMLFFLVPWARRLTGWTRRIVWIGGTAALATLAAIVLFLPWLEFPAALQPMLTAAVTGKWWMYSNWAPDLLALTVDRVLDPTTIDDPNAAHELVRFWAKLITRAIFVVYLGWELRRLWRIAGDHSRPLVEPILEASARGFVVLILVVMTWVLEWYWMWPLALVTLMGWRHPLTKIVVGYTLTSLPIFYVHHSWSNYMPGGIVLVYALPPLAVPVVAWAVRHWKGRTRTRLAASPLLRPGLGTALE